MKTRSIIMAVSFLMLGTIRIAECNATSGDVGTHSAQFLKMGLGSRAIAMGGAFVGLADDVGAVYWNPAGLVNVGRTELGFTHFSWFQDISYEYFACAKSFDKWGAFGLSIGYLHMGKLEGRDEDGNSTSDFTSSDIVTTLSYGHKITGELSVGVNVKYINEKIEEENAYAFAFDFGGLYKTPIKNFCLGGTIQNFGQSIKFVEEPCRLPTVFKLGSSYSKTLIGNPMNFAMDICFLSDNRTALHMGTEYTYKNALAGRIGYESGSDLRDSAGLSLGLGLTVTKTQTYGIDYAFISQGILGNTHAVSLSVKL